MNRIHKKGRLFNHKTNYEHLCGTRKCRYTWTVGCITTPTSELSIGRSSISSERAAYYGHLDILEWLIDNQFAFHREKCIEQVQLAIYGAEYLGWFKGVCEKQLCVLNWLGSEKSVDIPSQMNYE